MNSLSKHPKIKRSPLAKRLIIYMIMFSASITFTITIIQLYAEYQRDIKGIESQFSQVENVHLRSFTQSLWATNYQELRIQMEGLVTLPNIIYASVYSDDKLVVETGERNSENVIERKYTMEYEFLGKLNTIGVLTITTTLDNIYAELLRDVITIFVNNALRTLLVVIFMYFIFYHLISRHISRISEYFQQLVLEKNEPLVLDRKVLRVPDELDLLISSANDMQQRIINTHKAFSESEKKYHTLATVAPVGIFYTDTKGHCLYVNEKWTEITGMTADEAKGSGWIKGVYEKDKKHISHEWNKTAKQGVPFKLEYRFQKADRVRWVLGQAIAEEGSNGEIIGYVGTITDITERKKTEKALIESEERLRVIHSQVPGIVYQFKIDAEGKKSLPYVSPAVENYIGLTEQTVMDDVEKWFELTHPDDFSGLEESIAVSLENLSIWEWEGRFIRLDGEVIWLRGTATPKRMDDGSTVWNGLFVDVTERVRAEEVLRSSQKMDALGKLTGGIAHDYNNMLGVVLGYSELLSGRLEGQEKLQNYVKQIMHAGERGAKLTKKLLAFSKNKASDSARVNINEVLKDERHMLEKTLTARIRLELKLDDDLWPVYLDESELEDAVLNISINAMHAIESNGELVIETGNVQVNKNDAEVLGIAAGDYVQLGISDTGSGMNEAVREKIFDPFYTTKGDKGTGLGLSQVYGFINRCNGTVKVYSQPDLGTQLLLYFPRCPGEQESALEMNADVVSVVKGKESILVVDDEPALLEWMSEVIGQQGYHVQCADNAEQALEILKNRKVDLLISDIIMPDMDGFALASVVKEKYPLIKIQLASGFSDAEHFDQTDAELSENRLHKPYNAQTLLARVHELLQ